MSPSFRVLNCLGAALVVHAIAKAALEERPFTATIGVVVLAGVLFVLTSREKQDR